MHAGSQEGSNFHTSRHNSGNARNRNHSGGKKPAVVSRHLSGQGGLDRGSQAGPDAQQTTGEDSASSGIEDDQTLAYIASGMANTPGDFLFGDDSVASIQGFSCNLQVSTHVLLPYSFHVMRLYSNTAISCMTT